jgi:hypothetical protein
MVLLARPSLPHLWQVLALAPQMSQQSLQKHVDEDRPVPFVMHTFHVSNVIYA